MSDYKYEITLLETEEESEEVRFGAVSPEGEVLGALTYAFDGDLLAIRALFVEKEFRRQGIGTALLKALTETMSEENRAPIEMYFPRNEEHRSLQDFFAAQPNFTLEVGMRTLRFTPERRSSSKIWTSCVAAATETTPFFTLTNRTRNEFLMRLEKTLTPGASYDEEYSLCALKDNQIEAAILVERFSENEFFIDGSFGKRYEMLGVLGAFAKKLEEEHPDADLLLLSDENRQSAWVRNIFLEQGEAEDVLVARWNFRGL